MRKKLVSGETFYFIYPHEFGYPDYEKDLEKKEAIDINCPEHALVIGDAESYDPETDMAMNCFRTKAEAKKALKRINDILKGK